MRVFAYLRVSTDGQGESGLGLEAQREQIRLACEMKGWEPVFREEVESGRKNDRPVLTEMLADLRHNHMDGLVVSKLDRLARSIKQVDEVLSQSTKYGWTFCALDLGVDTSTATGRMVTNMIAAIAQWEGEMIGERTKAALAAKVARDPDCLKRPDQAVGSEVVKCITTWRNSGLTYKAIAELLEQQGFITAQGGKWHASSVRWIYYKSHRAQEEVV